MNNVDFSRCKRIVELIWDPEPTNDRLQDTPIWCLGYCYDLSSPPKSAATPSTNPPITDSVATIDTAASEPSDVTIDAKSEKGQHDAPISSEKESSLQSSTTSSFLSAPAYGGTGSDGGWPIAFLDDFESRIWMTYRSDFELINKSDDPNAKSNFSFTMRIKTQLMDQEGFTSDSGWGCMIRTGQSLLANTMVITKMGRSWRRGVYDTTERNIISQFADDPRAPYSIHSFVEHGAKACGKYPGEWFGPSATARCIQELVNRNDSGFRVYSTGDTADVYEDSFMQVAKPDGKQFAPTLVLVTTRLGIDKVTPVYWEALVATLQMPSSVGIAGGRPSSSHYFVGAQGMYLFYLDPHITQPALKYHDDVSEYSTEEIATYHTRRLRKLHVKEMDPSMLIGFLIRDENEWRDWRAGLKHVQGRPVISVFDTNPMNHMDALDNATYDVESMSEAEADDLEESAEDLGREL
ncbi:hypothetical protein TD95_002523 [Thielaviopsis punctulata]|uniref:Cysteine protease n=1 Tax=Thielaviopsis punctulata TaxID=72032 RepID=A0A0F4ZFJ7_9PEZI|nr:hypothetical protein TD95_002523 [Thielaviopsis punctulata]